MLAAQNTRNVYPGNGTPGPWPIACGSQGIRFRSREYIRVRLLAADMSERDLVEGTDYNISGGPDNGAIMLTFDLAAGEFLAVWREQPVDQDTDISHSDDFDSQMVERTWDKSREIDQELAERISRRLAFPATDPLDMDYELPPSPLRRNTLMGFGDDGAPVLVDREDAPAFVSGGPLGVRSVETGGTGGTTPEAARTNIGVGRIGTLDDLAAGDISAPHAALDHRPIIRAYNQAYVTEVQQDLGLYVVESATTAALPNLMPAEGTAYLLPASAPANANLIAIVAGGAWIYRTPAKGWRALAKDLDTEWFHDGIAWALTSGAGSSSGMTTGNAGRVAGFALTNGHGGSRFRAHWTIDQRIEIYGDQSGLGFDPAGDSWNGFVVAWDRASNGNIVKMFAGINYLLILTDQAVGNLYHMGATDHGQGGRGLTAGTTLVPTRITQFVTDAVKISHVWTEASLVNTDKFWFARTTAGNVYSCGRGTNNTQGNNSASDLSTPRKMTLSDGTTPLSNVVEITCSTVYAPVWARLTTGEAYRWGAGTDGAHGNNNAASIGWPAKLETAPGSGIARTDIAQIVGTGSSQGTTRAVTWLRTTAGKIESSGSRHHGNGDGAALTGAAVNTFQPAAGAIAVLTVTSLFAGGGEYYTAVAITSTGQGYMAGYVASYAQLGNGATTNLNTWTLLSGLPAGFAGALTSARVAGGGSFATVYLEATISGMKRLASIGYDAVYQTGKGTAGIAAASQTWGLVLGACGAISAWQSVGDHSAFGLEVLDADGLLWYAGANDQGQSGTQFGNLRSVAYLQPCILALQNASRWDAGARLEVNPLTTSGVTLSFADAGRLHMAAIPGPISTAVNTIRLPSNSIDPIPIGANFEFVRTPGTALIRFVPDSTGEAQITTPPDSVLAGDNSWCRLVKFGANQWTLFGQTGGAPSTSITAAIWLDPSDLSTMRQERTGSSAPTPAVVDGVVGSVRNKGTIGGWFVAAADSRRPVLRSNGTLYWLEFDGADDYLSLTSPALDLATIEVFIGARIMGSAGTAAGMVTFAPASGGDFNSNTAFTIYTNYTDYDVAVSGGSGTTMAFNAAGLMLRPHVIELHKADNTSAAIVIDNAAAATDSVSSAFTTMGGDLIIGARYANGVNTFGHFALYNLVVTNTVVADKTAIRQYMETKTGNNGPVYPDIADLTELADARDTLIGEVFATAGGVLPTGLATLAVESPHPLNGIVTLTNLNTCEKMTIPGYAARPRLWTPNSARSDVIVLLCAGHSVAWNGNGLAAVAMQTLLTANIRVCTFVLPNGPNDYTSGGPADHEAAQPALSEWVGPVVIAINKLLADYPGAQIYIAGISGGGWMANICGACDVRIEGTYHFVGTLPDYIHINRDWEQRLPGLTADYLTLYLLGACPGRRNKQILYENDPVGFNRAATNTRPGWSVQLAAQAAALGGGDYDLAWVNHNQHTFVNPSFTTEFVNELP